MGCWPLGCCLLSSRQKRFVGAIKLVFPCAHTKSHLMQYVTFSYWRFHHDDLKCIHVITTTTTTTKTHKKCWDKTVLFFHPECLGAVSIRFNYIFTILPVEEFPLSRSNGLTPLNHEYLYLEIQSSYWNRAIVYYMKWELFSITNTWHQA